MCDFVDDGRDRLHFAHTLADGNSLIIQGKIAVCVIRNRLEVNRHGRGTPQGFHKNIEVLHIALQVSGELRQGLSVCLRHIKDGDGLEHRDFDFLFLDDNLAVCIQHGQVGVGVSLFLFDFLLEGCGSDDFDSFFAFHHVTLELVSPLIETCHQSSIGLLHIDEHRVVHAVLVKTAHCAEIFGILVRLKEFFNPSFYAVGDVFESFLVGLLFVLRHRLLLSKN